MINNYSTLPIYHFNIHPIHHTYISPVSFLPYLLISRLGTKKYLPDRSFNRLVFRAGPARFGSRIPTVDRFVLSTATIPSHYILLSYSPFFPQVPSPKLTNSIIPTLVPGRKRLLLVSCRSRYSLTYLASSQTIGFNFSTANPFTTPIFLFPLASTQINLQTLL